MALGVRKDAKKQSRVLWGSRKDDIYFASYPEGLCEDDFHIIAVPTPINSAKQPDLSALLSASEILGRVIKPGDVVVYESTVYPGCTEDNCIPVLERESGLKCNTDFAVGYSP